MDSVQVGKMQSLFCQHLEALEMAVKLGRQYEQVLASFTTDGQGQLSVQTSSSQPFNTTSVLKGCKADSLREPLLTAVPKMQEMKTSPRQPSPRQSRTLHCCSTIEVESAMKLEVSSARSQENIGLSVKRSTRRMSLSLQEKEAILYQDIFKIEGLARLRMNRAFNLICFAAILGNAIWVGIDTDFAMDSEAHPSLIPEMIFNMFCGWYFFELVVWFSAFKRIKTALMNGWFVSHASIVGLMVWGLWVQPLADLPEIITLRHVKYLSFLTVFRLAHIARVAHIFDNSPEIMLYATGVFKGIQSTAPLLLFLGANVYVFAIAFKWLLSGTNLDDFETVLHSCHFLFWNAFGSVDKNLFKTMLTIGFLPWALLVAYTLIANLTVAKMLTGVLLQVVNKIIEKEKHKADAAVLEQTMQTLAQALDADGDGSVSKEEFQVLMANQDLIDCMLRHQVDIAAFADFTNAYFAAGAELFTDDIKRLAKQFCGSKHASVTDIMNLRKLVSLQTEFLQRGQAQIQKNQAQIIEDLKPLRRTSI